MKINGAWTQILSDWLDQQNLIAPQLRSQLDSLSATDQISVARWQALLQQAVALRPNAVAPGLAIGSLVQPRHVGMLGYLVLSCSTLGDALLAYHRYESLFYGDQLAQVHSDGAQIQIAWPQIASTGTLADSVSISALIRFLTRLVAELPPPTAVEFVFAEPNTADCAAFNAFFRCPVHFGCRHTRITFPTHLMQIPLRHSDSGLRELLNRQADALLHARPNSAPFERSLQQLLARLLPEGRGNLPAMASAMHLSERTLQRRLAQRQLTWRTLLDNTRATLAEDYLADGSLSLADIALLLGFSEHSAFSRAYQRWTGKTPGRARRQLLDKR